jgi:hypothetical protein
MSEQEKDRAKSASDDPEVEAHRAKSRDEAGPEDEIGRRETDDESDVEAHRFKSS